MIFISGGPPLAESSDTTWKQIDKEREQNRREALGLDKWGLQLFCNVILLLKTEMKNYRRTDWIENNVE